MLFFMKTFQFLLLFGMALSMAFGAQAQVMKPTELPTEKVTHPSRRVMPYLPLRQADLMWHRRIWRVIDLREKMNQFMYYPLEPTNGRKNFITLVMDAILKDKTVTAYDPMYDDFKVRLARNFEHDLWEQ